MTIFLYKSIFCWRVLEPGAQSTFGNILPQFSHKGRKYSLVEAIMGWAYLAGYELQPKRKLPNLWKNCVTMAPVADHYGQLLIFQDIGFQPNKKLRLNKKNARKSTGRCARLTCIDCRDSINSRDCRDYRDCRDWRDCRDCINSGDWRDWRDCRDCRSCPYCSYCSPCSYLS